MSSLCTLWSILILNAIGEEEIKLSKLARDAPYLKKRRMLMKERMLDLYCCQICYHEDERSATKFIGRQQDRDFNLVSFILVKSDWLIGISPTLGSPVAMRKMIENRNWCSNELFKLTAPAVLVVRHLIVSNQLVQFEGAIKFYKDILWSAG
ncbi:hypothetical protein ACLOJK_022689 [Asimina triloba]